MMDFGMNDDGFWDGHLAKYDWIKIPFRSDKRDKPGKEVLLKKHQLETISSFCDIFGTTWMNASSFFWCNPSHFFFGEFLPFFW